MKKILSAILALTMIVSLAAVFAVPAAAYEEGEGMWTVLASEDQYAWDYGDDKKSVPGYRYTVEGFQTFGGEWKNDSPYQHVQTKQAIDIRNGVYMEVRVDEFDYSAMDKWFNFNIWSDENFVPCSGDAKWGEGVQTFLRPGSANAETGEPGKVSAVAWYTNQFTAVGNNSIYEENRTTVEKDGNIHLTFNLEITWDYSYGYSVFINGTQAPERVIEYMNDAFKDGMAYIGFAMYSSDRGAAQSCTVTKFGTSKATAAVPIGSDYKEPEIYETTYAHIMDPMAVPEGMPAIFMSGDIANSHLKALPSSGTGAILSITEDNLVHLITSNATADFGTWKVDNDISFDVCDFPIMMCLTKNFCSCGMGAHVDCMALESTKAYVMVGDIIAADPKHAYNELDICYDPYLIENGEDADNYLTFTLDFSDTEETGRFNGVRIDAQGVDLRTQGFIEFEMCWIGLFRTEEEAQAFAEAYLTELGWENGCTLPDEETTHPDDDSETEDQGYTTEYETSFNDTEVTEQETEYELEEIYDYIELEDSITVDASEGYKEFFFEFSPTRNGKFYFYSTGDHEVFGEILDEDGNVLAVGESEDGLNFVASYSFRKGKTYYLRTGMIAGENGEYEIHLKKKNPNASNNSAEKADKLENAGSFDLSALGCSMSAGFGGVAIVAVAMISAGFASKRRKDNE